MDKLRGSLAAITFGVFATLALDVYSTLNSSPQTTELFAKDREDSLMHWVYFGDGVALTAGAVWTVRNRDPIPIIAAGSVVVMMHLAYVHALERGKDQKAPARS
jgi:hypothetical protein